MIILQTLAALIALGGALLALHYAKEAKEFYPAFLCAKAEYKKLFGSLDAYQYNKYMLRVMIIKSTVATLFALYFFFMVVVLNNPIAWL